MPYDLPFELKNKLKIKREREPHPDPVLLDKIARGQRFMESVGQHPYSPLTYDLGFLKRDPKTWTDNEILLANKREMERVSTLIRSPEEQAELTKPLFGIIPGGSGFGDFFETLNLPFTYTGGSMVEAFTKNPFRKPGLPTKSGFRSGLSEYNPLNWPEDIRSTIERQQKRSTGVRMASEAISPFEAVGVVRGAIGASKLAKGLIKPTIAKAASLSERPIGTRTERLKVLEEYGLIPDSSINKFAFPIRDWDSVLSEVRTTDNPAVKIAIAKTGINPSLARSSDVGRAITAYQRQLVAIDNLTDIAIPAAYDVHASGYTGQMSRILPIDKDGFFSDTGVLWQKVFENPNLYRGKISKRTRALIDDYNEVTNYEIPRLLDDAGITLRERSRPQGQYYVPRDVEAIRGIELTRHSNPELQRHYDDIMEGLDAGIDYSKDPRNSLILHLRWAQRKIAKKQLDDALEPLGLSPKEVLKVKNPDVIARYEQAIKSRHTLEVGLRGIKRGLRTVNVHLRLGGERISGREKLLSITDDDLESLDQYIQSLGIPPHTREPRVLFTKPEILDFKRMVEAGEGRKIHKKLLDRLDQYIQSLDVLPYTKEPKVPLMGPDVRALKRLVKAREARDRYKYLSDRLDKIQFTEPELKSKASEVQILKKLVKAREARKRYKQLSGRAETQAQSVRRANRVQAELEGQEALLSSFKDNAELQLANARAEHSSAKNAYSRGIDEYRKSQETTAFWGPNQPNEIRMENWRNRFFPAEDAQLLRSQLEQRGIKTLSDKAFRSLEIAGNSIRYLSSVGDFAMPLIQGPLLMSSGTLGPDRWARMTLRHYQAFFDPTVQSRLIRDNIDDFVWVAKHAIPVGDPEFFAALKPGQGVSFDWLFKSVPKGEEARRLFRLGGQQSFGRFQASYNTGLGWSRVLLYKGIKDSFRGTEAELAQYIRNMTGGLDARALGVGPSQRSIEGMFLAFSPRLLRSTVALAWDAFANPTSPQGQAALKSIATLLTGAAGVYVVTGLGLHKSWKEIETGLNPLNGKRFMSHQINGDWIGIGGQVRALTQLMAALTIGAAKDPKSLVSTSLFENPFIRFLAGRGAPGSEIIGSIVEGISQGEVNTLPYDVVDGPLDIVKHLGTNMAPFTAQGILEGEQLQTSLSSFVGARTSAETIFERRDLALQQEMTRLQIPGKYKDLDPDVRRNVSQSSSVKQAESQVAAQLRKESNRVQLFKDKLTSVDKKYSDLILRAEEELKPGKKLRESYATHERDRAHDKQQIRDENQDIIKVWDELFPAESAFELAYDDYTSAINDKQLENEATLGYDFDLREKLISEVRSKHGNDMINRVEEFIHQHETPLQKRLRKDRATLKPYWEVSQAVLTLDLSPKVKSVWTEYLQASPNQQRLLELQNPWILKLNRVVDDVKTQVRDANPDIDAALVLWEYGPRPRTTQGIEAFKESVGVP